MIQRYHYLGYHPLPGAQIRYLIFSANSQLLAALGFGAAAWKIAPRERWTGACYRAANWIHLGQTQGRGKLDHQHKNAAPIKDLYLYSLYKHFQKTLRGQGYILRIIRVKRMFTPVEVWARGLRGPS